MESLNSPHGPSSISEGESPSSDFVVESSQEEIVIQGINKLENHLYNRFTQVQQKLEQCEKTITSAVGKVFNDVRTSNIEGFDAVQLDLEVLRQKVKNQELDLHIRSPTKFLEELPVDSMVLCNLTIDSRKVTNYLLNNLKCHFKLPSAYMTSQAEASLQVDNSILFEKIAARADTGGMMFPFEELLREKEERTARNKGLDIGEGTKSLLLTPTCKTPVNGEVVTLSPSNLLPKVQPLQAPIHTSRTVLIASLCSVLVSLLLQLLLVLLR